MKYLLIMRHRTSDNPYPGKIIRTETISWNEYAARFGGDRPEILADEETPEERADRQLEEFENWVDRAQEAQG